MATGRLTAELILRSPQHLDPTSLYSLDLRGNKISVIENLGATQDQFASIDLCDNAIARLDGFPRLARLRQLLLANNRVAKVSPGLGDLLPGLQTLVLTNNRIAELRDLAPLAAFRGTLTLLALRGNPCAARPHYRAYVVSLLPALKVLDFTKVKAQEREEGRRRFPEGCAAPAPPVGAAAAAAANGGGAGAAGAAGGGGAEGAAGAAAAAADGGRTAEPPSQKQMMALQAAIAGAATIEEVERLEAALAAGGAGDPEAVAAGGAGGDPGAVAAAAADGG